MRQDDAYSSVSYIHFKAMGILFYDDKLFKKQKQQKLQIKY